MCCTAEELPPTTTLWELENDFPPPVAGDFHNGDSPTRLHSAGLDDQGAGDDVVVLPSTQFATASNDLHLYKCFPALFPFARGAHGDPARRKPLSSEAVTVLKLDDCTRAYGRCSAFIFDRYR